MMTIVCGVSGVETLLTYSSAADYVQHCIGAFNGRACSLDNELCRLALFLDPRYREGAASKGNIQPIIVKVSLFLPVTEVTVPLMLSSQMCFKKHL